MNKRQFVDKLSQAFDTSKVNAEAMLETFIATIESSLLNWEEVNIPWFGKFEVRSRKSKPWFNPRTKETITINAYCTPVFKAGKPLKDKVRAKFN